MCNVLFPYICVGSIKGGGWGNDNLYIYEIHNENFNDLEESLLAGWNISWIALIKVTLLCLMVDKVIKSLKY